MSRGLSLADFSSLTPGECSAWLDTDRRLRESEQRDAWERARLAAAVSVSPYLSKGASRDPRRIIPLPWDKGGGEKEKAPAREMTREEADALFEKRIRERKAT